MHYLRLERGLSEHTRSNYQRDIRKLSAFDAKQEAPAGPLRMQREDVEGFIHLISAELHPRSQARILSALRGFFDYLVFEDHRDQNPMALIRSPKTGRKLPDTLSQEEIDRMIEAIDRSREMYDKRVQAPVAAKFDYFNYELVNTLAEGDEGKLGNSYPGASI